MMSLWATTYDTQKHVCAFTSPVHGRSLTPYRYLKASLNEELNYLQNLAANVLYRGDRQWCLAV